MCTIRKIAISETLGDIAVVYQPILLFEKATSHRSDLKVYTINARPVGHVVSKQKITSLCYSNSVEGMSVNLIATGLENGIIRYIIIKYHF